MLKKLTALLAAIIIFMTLSSCKGNEPSHKTGWNNPEEPDTGETTTAEETTLTDVTTEAAAQIATEISMKTAEKVHTEVAALVNGLIK